MPSLLPRRLILCLPVTLAAIAGCTSLQHPVPIDWEHGARRGIVIRQFDAGTPRDSLPVCLSRLSPAEIAAHRYVEVEAMHRRHVYRDVGDLPTGMIVRAGDAVEIYTKNCEAGSLSIISRLLPTAPS